MAEIIDSEKIRQKLKEFDSYIKQNLDILQTLKGIQIDSEKIFSDMQTKKDIASRIEIELIEFQDRAKKIGEEISSLKEKKVKELSDFINTYRQKAEIITLDIELRKKELSLFIENSLKKFRSELENFYVSVTNEIQQNKHQNDREIELLKTQINEYQESMDKKIADFLYKQNALVSNLNQQIDSYHKLTDTIKDTIEAQSDEIKKLQNASQEYKRQIDSLNAENDYFKAKLEEIMSEIKKPFVKRLFGGKK